MSMSIEAGAMNVNKTSSSVELMYMLRSPNRAMDPDMSECQVEHTRLSVRIETAARATYVALLPWKAGDPAGIILSGPQSRMYLCCL
mmetsp:Transcript_20148/g.56111  ORF Transcript_20148/g.56111 Transcript_20148/m.56111 type:complete len:87 (+) Transcript_20148:1152-1412(+)